MSRDSRGIMRCAVCDRVNRLEIAHESGENFYTGHFQDDPHGPGYICDVCSGSINSVASDYLDTDDDYDWFMMEYEGLEEDE